MVVLMLRGPYCPTAQWFGWKGGYSLKRPEVEGVEVRETKASV